MNARVTRRTIVAGCLLWYLASATIAADPQESIQHRDGSTMLLVPAGPFTMGSGEANDETPPHRVDLPAFYIDRT